jgi:hypothetical protein
MTDPGSEQGWSSGNGLELGRDAQAPFSPARILVINGSALTERFGPAENVREPTLLEIACATFGASRASV